MRHASPSVIGALLVALAALLSGCELEERRIRPASSGPVAAIIACGLGQTIQVVSRETPRRLETVAATLSGPGRLLIDGGELYVVCSLSNTVQVFGMEDWRERRRLDTGPRTNPIGMAFGSGRRLWVSCYVSNEVLALDRDTGAVEMRIPMPPPGELPVDAAGTRSAARPDGVLVHEGKVLVTLANLTTDTSVAAGPGLLAVIGEAAGTLERVTVLTARNPGAIAADPTDPAHVWVSGRGDYAPGTGFTGNGVLELLEPAGGSAPRLVACGGAPGLAAFGPDGLVFLGNARESLLLVVNAFSLRPEAPILVPPPQTGDLSYIAGTATDGEGGLWAVEFNSSRLYRYDARSKALLEGPYETGLGPVEVVGAAGE